MDCDVQGVRRRAYRAHFRAHPDKRKWLWGGWPLSHGYEVKDGKLVVIEGEAERVQFDASV